VQSWVSQCHGSIQGQQAWLVVQSWVSQGHGSRQGQQVLFRSLLTTKIAHRKFEDVLLENLHGK